MESLGIARLEQEPLMIAFRSAAKKGPTIDFGGLVEEMAPLFNAEEDSKDSIRRAWRILDEGRRGHIRVDDLTSMIRRLDLNLSLEEVRDMVWHADTNKDGEVTFDDFYAVLVKGPDDGRDAGRTAARW